MPTPGEQGQKTAAVMKLNERNKKKKKSEYSQQNLSGRGFDVIDQRSIIVLTLTPQRASTESNATSFMTTEI